jgi:hypothetical protein
MAVHARAIESGVRCCFQKSGNLPALIQVVRSILAATCGGGKIEPEAIVA